MTHRRGGVPVARADELARAIGAYRKRRSGGGRLLSLRALAAELGVSHASVGAWLRGSAYPTEESLYRVRSVLGLTLGNSVEAGAEGIGESFAERLAHYRQLRGIEQRGFAWTRSELAERVGVSPETVKQWEEGTYRPRPFHAERLREVLVVSHDELLLEAGRSQSLGSRLRELRLQWGRSRGDSFGQAELARNLGVRRDTISSWESGRTSPSETSLYALARFFSVDPLWLRGESRDVEPPLPETLGERIRHFRAAAGLRRGYPISHEELAEMAGVSRYSIQAWEAGVHRPAPFRLRRLAAALGVTEELLRADVLAR